MVKLDQLLEMLLTVEHVLSKELDHIEFSDDDLDKLRIELGRIQREALRLHRSIQRLMHEWME